MSESKYTDKVCVFILVLTLIVTCLFINGERLGIVKTESDTMANEEGTFSDRDFMESWSEKNAVLIDLNDMEHLAEKGAYELDGDLYLVEKGTYVLSGSLSNHQVLVEAKGAKLQIVLNGAEISMENQPAILVKKADKVFLTLEEKSENTIYADLSAETEETDLPDAALYSESDLTINGAGSLYVTAKGGHGIKSKDDLVITNGNITVDASETALLGKDSVRIADGVFDLTAGNDGIKANNDSDENKGYVTIKGGSFQIDAGHDGIQAETDITVEDGEISILTGGGAEEAELRREESGFMGGNPFGQGGFGRGNSAGNSDKNAEGKNRKERFEGQRGTFWQPEETDAPKEMEAPEEFGGNEMPGMPEGMEPPEGFDGSGRPEMPGGMEPPEGFDGSEMPEMPEGMEPPECFDGSGRPEMPEGMEPPGGFDGSGRPEMPEEMEAPEGSAGSESDSYKGMKAGRKILISGGSIEVNVKEDGLHSDGDLEISGGKMKIAAGDDGIHAETDLVISGGNVEIEKSYEGIEGNQLLISGGNIHVTSSDDGINATGGESGFGFGRMNFMGGFGNAQDDSAAAKQKEETNRSLELPLLHIIGGRVQINASGDGLDSNGDLIVDGGEIMVDGPQNDANGALDSGTESGGDCIVNGGTLIALGASGMAENFSENSTQCSFLCTFSSYFNENDQIEISDAEGTVIYNYTAKKSGNSIVFSSPELKLGETYTILAGEQKEEMTLDAIANGRGFSMGRFGGFR